MKTQNSDRLLRLMDGTLTAFEEEAVRREMASSPELRGEYERLSTMRDILRVSVEEDARNALQPFFTERLLRKLKPTGSTMESDFLASLSALFRPVIAAGLVIIVALLAYNVMTVSYEADQSATEVALGLPPVTLATAYDLDLGTR